MTLSYTVNLVERTQETKQAPFSSNASLLSPPVTAGRRVLGGTPIGMTGWRLAVDLGVELQYTEQTVVAVAPCIDDYGQGLSESEAIVNLLTSLVDFRESLERRAAKAVLAEELSVTLTKLRTLLAR